jgi:hypothetical protein
MRRSGGGLPVMQVTAGWNFQPSAAVQPVKRRAKAEEEVPRWFPSANIRFSTWAEDCVTG